MPASLVTYADALKEDYMPFKSEKQRRFMWARHPKIARRWAEEEKGKALPSRKTARNRHMQGAKSK